MVNYWIKKSSSDLIRYTFGILRDEERAKDVVQEAFMKLIDEDPAQIEKLLPQWLYRVCRNAAIDIWRREKKVDIFGEGQEGAVQDETASAETSLADQQSMTIMLREISKLDAKHQEVLRLKFNDELSYKEISEITGYTVTNVGFILHEAVQKLKEKVKKGGG